MSRITDAYDRGFRDGMEAAAKWAVETSPAQGLILAAIPRRKECPIYLFPERRNDPPDIPTRPDNDPKEKAMDKDEATEIEGGKVVYIITEGDYSDYGILGCVAGPRGLNIGGLYREFRPNGDRYGFVGPETFRLFVAWLCKYHGCSKFEADKVHLE